MSNRSGSADLAGRRVLVPGGTGGVGEGVVRAFLAAGAEVAVPTRTVERSEELRAALGPVPLDRLHVLVQDYTTFAGAEQLVDQVLGLLGGLDAVVASVGGWWSGPTLTEISEDDWRDAFVALATTHMAVLRASLPRMSPDGLYAVIVGDSAVVPVPRSGLVSMEQAALLMMQQVAAVEAPDRRIFAFLLGPVRTRFAVTDTLGVSADQVGAVATAMTAAAHLSGRTIPLHDDRETRAALRLAADHG